MGAALVGRGVVAGPRRLDCLLCPGAFWNLPGLAWGASGLADQGGSIIFWRQPGWRMGSPN